jgi:hypothetical protein
MVGSSQRLAESRSADAPDPDLTSAASRRCDDRTGRDRRRTSHRDHRDRQAEEEQAALERWSRTAVRCR